jgi:hypothetical protein
MTKLKEVNTYTLEELKWYKFWYDNRAVIKPSLDSKFKEALDEESKTEIEFDLDDLKLIKSGADNYYNHNVRDDYKMSIEEDNILDKLDARISFLRKMKKVTESELDCKSENPNAFIMCECRGIATGMCDIELRLSNVIRECIEHGYDVEYKYNDNYISKGYIQSGEMIHNLKNNTISFKIEFVSTNDDCEFDIYSKNLDLKAIRFDDKTNTLHLQENA